MALKSYVVALYLGYTSMTLVPGNENTHSPPINHPWCAMISSNLLTSSIWPQKPMLLEGLMVSSVKARAQSFGFKVSITSLSFSHQR